MTSGTKQQSWQKKYSGLWITIYYLTWSALWIYLDIIHKQLTRQWFSYAVTASLVHVILLHGGCCNSLQKSVYPCNRHLAYLHLTYLIIVSCSVSFMIDTMATASWTDHQNRHAHISQQSISNLKVLHARRVPRRQVHIEDPLTLSPTVQNSVTWVIWHPGAQHLGARYLFLVTGSSTSWWDSHSDTRDRASHILTPTCIKH